MFEAMVTRAEQRSMPLLTASRLKCARRCAREHQYRYIERFAPAVEADALRYGTGIHLLLEAWWRAEPGSRLAEAMAALAGYQWADEYERVRAEAMLVGYHVRWDGAADEYDALVVEARFEAPLRNPATNAASRTWMLAGKLDGIVRERATGRVLVLEHKTTSEECGPGSTYLQRLRLDGQVSLYYVGAESLLGHAVDGCLYDVLRKPALRPAKATPPETRKYTKAGALYAGQRDQDETPEEYRARLFDAIAEDPSRYYVRAEVPRLEHELAEAMHDVWQTGRVLRENELRGFHPRNPDACMRYGRACEFFSVCCGEANLGDPQLYRQMESAYPELTL